MPRADKQSETSKGWHLRFSGKISAYLNSWINQWKRIKRNLGEDLFFEADHEEGVARVSRSDPPFSPRAADSEPSRHAAKLQCVAAERAGAKTSLPEKRAFFGARPKSANIFTPTEPAIFHQTTF